MGQGDRDQKTIDGIKREKKRRRFCAGEQAPGRTVPAARRDFRRRFHAWIFAGPQPVRFQAARRGREAPERDPTVPRLAVAARQKSKAKPAERTRSHASANRFRLGFLPLRRTEDDRRSSAAARRRRSPRRNRRSPKPRSRSRKSAKPAKSSAPPMHRSFPRARSCCRLRRVQTRRRCAGARAGAAAEEISGVCHHARRRQILSRPGRTVRRCPIRCGCAPRSGSQRFQIHRQAVKFQITARLSQRAAAGESPVYNAEAMNSVEDGSPSARARLRRRARSGISSIQHSYSRMDCSGNVDRRGFERTSAICFAAGMAARRGVLRAQRAVVLHGDAPVRTASRDRKREQYLLWWCSRRRRFTPHSRWESHGFAVSERRAHASPRLSCGFRWNSHSCIFRTSDFRGTCSAMSLRETLRSCN